MAFCLLSVICKQQLKQCNHSVDQSVLLTGFRTDFTSSVWNFCRWVADVHPCETSPAARSEGKRLFTPVKFCRKQKANWIPPLKNGPEPTKTKNRSADNVKNTSPPRVAYLSRDRIIWHWSADTFFDSCQLTIASIKVWHLTFGVRTIGRRAYADVTIKVSRMHEKIFSNGAPLTRGYYNCLSKSQLFLRINCAEICR